MKAYSAIRQDPIWIKDKSELNLKMRIRWNEKEIIRTDMGDKTRIEYEYDEEEIIHEVPEDIKLEEFSLYLKDKVPDLLAEAKAKVIPEPEPEPEPEPIKIKTLKAASVLDVRQLVDMKKITVDIDKEIIK
jgi:hypothetical protein